jgi:hypothetical protein
MTTPADDDRAIRGAEINERDAWEDLYAAAPADWAAQHGLRTLRLGPILAIALADLPSPQFNRAWGVGLERPLDAAELAELEAFFRAAGSRTWMVQPAPLAHAGASIERLRAAGYERVPMRWVKVVRPTRVPPGGAPNRPQHVARDGLSVAEVGPGQREAFAGPIVRGMGMPPWMRAWVEALVGRPGWRCFAATVDGQPAGGAALYLREGRGWFGLATTLPDCRRRGAQRAMLTQRIDAALDAGADFLSIETGEPMPGTESPSFHNMTACGFVPIAYRENLGKRA